MILAFGKDLSVGVDLEYVDKNYPVKKSLRDSLPPRNRRPLSKPIPIDLLAFSLRYGCEKRRFLKPSDEACHYPSTVLKFPPILPAFVPKNLQ